MQTLWDVAYDLYSFAVIEWFGFRSVKNNVSPTVNNQLPQQADLFDQSVVYVQVEQAALHAFPTQTFDGVIGQLPYGTAVAAGQPSGRWLEVTHNDITGWILREAVVSDTAAVFPTLIDGVTYGAHDLETKQIRRYLFDMFAGGSESLPLQDTEYCMYRLVRKGHFIAWPTERPRIAGRWQTILKGVTGIHMSIEPVADSVMEVITEDGSGYLAYVEAVLPEKALTIREVGQETAGEYTARTVPQTVWRELRPVFIAVK